MLYRQVSYSAWKYTNIYYEQQNTEDVYSSLSLYKSSGLRLGITYDQSTKP